MKTCSVCGKPFDPAQPPTEPAEQAGAFMARELYGDTGELCLPCLASRGRLGMMYLHEFD